LFNRIRLSLTGWYIAILLVILLVIGVVTYVALSRSLSDEVDESLRSSARAVALQIDTQSLETIKSTPIVNSTPVADGNDDHGEDEDHEGDEDEDEDDVRYFSPSGGDTFYLILATDGTPISNPANVLADGIPDEKAARTAVARGEVWSNVQTADAELRLYSLSVREEDDAIAVVQVGRSLAEHKRQLTGLLLVLGIAGGTGLVLAAAGGLIVAGRALRPIKMSFERQRAFVADASHELRTPLTVIRGNAELLELSERASLSETDRRELEDIVAHSKYMEQLVSDLAVLARLDEGELPLRREAVAVGEVLESVARSAEVLSAGRIKVTWNAPEGMTVTADPVRLQELLLALAENAVSHTLVGGHISIEAEDGREATIRVKDSGPGIPPSELGRIFDRFYRLDEARSRSGGGTGLGLSIAQAIAHAHGGNLTAENAPDGGALLTLILPRSS
jgi:two-component system sensor histidine kinase CiaH